MGRTGSAFQLWLDTSLKEQLQRLAETNGRSLTEEMTHALLRHVASPPELVTPPLASAPSPVPKKKPGRPRNPIAANPAPKSRAPRPKKK